MRLRVLLFAVLAQRLDHDAIEAVLPDGATVSDLLDALSEAHPAIAELRPSLAVAVNHAYAPATQTLQESDEVALIPPVSGG